MSRDNSVITPYTPHVFRPLFAPDQHTQLKRSGSATTITTSNKKRCFQHKRWASAAALPTLAPRPPPQAMMTPHMYRTTAQDESFKRPMLAHPSGPQPAAQTPHSVGPSTRYPCQSCTKTFSHSNDLKRHVRSKHAPKTTKYFCKEAQEPSHRLILKISDCKACLLPKPYAAKQNAMDHLRRMHFGGKRKDQDGWLTPAQLKDWIEEKTVEQS